MSIQDIEQLLEKGDINTLCELSISEWAQVCSHVMRIRKMNHTWEQVVSLRYKQGNLGEKELEGFLK